MRFNLHLDSNFSERFAYCKQFKEAWRQDLFWLISSYPLSKSLLPNWHISLFEKQNLSDLFNEVSGLKSMKVEHKLPLGKYAERLLLHYFIHSDTIQLLANNIQLNENQKTIGELDFILQKNSELLHIEVALKFFIERFGKTEEDLIGPNGKDTWINKKQKLLQQQLPILEISAQQQYDSKSIKSCCWIAGELFPLASNHLDQKTWALKQSTLSNIKIKANYFALIPFKRDWIFPFNRFSSLQNIAEIKKINKPLTKSVMLVLYDQKKIPISRGFILNDNWPNTIS